MRRRLRFAAHEELLSLRGWNSICWSAAADQRISIVRPLDATAARRLTSNEFDLACAVAVGIGVKQAAAELGLEWATGRTTLSRALHKLGLQSCAQLPLFWHGLSGTVCRSPADETTELLVFVSRLDRHALPVRLTSAESDVLRAVLVGLNNQQIARHRITSVRTVANQLATLFQKFGASSKGELAAKALLLHSSDQDAE